MARVVVTTSLVLPAGATLAVHGDHPLIFIVHGGAAIDGVIDVSARGARAAATRPAAAAVAGSGGSSCVASRRPRRSTAAPS